MTIPYALPRFGYLQLLLRWRGSVWSAVWRRFTLWYSVYIVIALLFHLALSKTQKVNFAAVAVYLEDMSSRIPLQFILGFYVVLMVERWWRQLESLAWPDELILKMSGFIRGNDTESQNIRITMARYAILSTVLALRNYSVKILKQFPTLSHLENSALATAEEIKSLSKHRGTLGMDLFNVPLIWSANIVDDCYKVQRCTSEEKCILVGAIESVRQKLFTLSSYDRTPVPLAYAQVVTIAVYGYFMFALVGKQTYRVESTATTFIAVREDELSGPGGNYTMIDGNDAGKFSEFMPFFPIVTIVEFVFYMGWLSVAESFCEPHGEDDEDFEVLHMLERNVTVSKVLTSLECPLILQVASPKLQHTVASRKFAESVYEGRLTNYSLSPDDMTIIGGGAKRPVNVKQIALKAAAMIGVQSEVKVEDCGEDQNRNYRW